MTHIISFFGAPGVGKTTLANELSRQTGYYFFDRDILLDAVFKDDRESELYKNWAGKMTKSTWDLANYNARNGASSILESPMLPALQGKDASFFSDTIKAGKEQGFSLDLIYCVAPSEVVLEYMKARGAARDEPKYADWKAFEDQWLNVPGPKDDYKHLRVDTSLPIDDNLQRIFDYVSFKGECFCR